MCLRVRVGGEKGVVVLHDHHVAVAAQFAADVDDAAVGRGEHRVAQAAGDVQCPCCACRRSARAWRPLAGRMKAACALRCGVRLADGLPAGGAGGGRAAAVRVVQAIRPAAATNDEAGAEERGSWIAWRFLERIRRQGFPGVPGRGAFLARHAAARASAGACSEGWRASTAARGPASTMRPASISTTVSKRSSRLRRWIDATTQASGKAAAMRSSTRRFGGGIERAGRLVEQQQRAALRGQHAARQAQPLPLAARQVEAALGQRRVQIAVRRRQHLVEGAGMQRGAERVVVERLAEAQVLAHAGLEHLGLLRDQRGDAAQPRPGRRLRRRSRSVPPCGA